MKHLATAALLALGSLLLALGLLFLLGSGGRGYRLIVAMVSLSVGGGLIGLGVRRFRYISRETPAFLRAELLRVAAMHNGELSWSQLVAALGQRAERVRSVLDEFCATDMCQRHLADGDEYFVFDDLQPRLMVMHCGYCRADFVLNEAPERCPSCGGTLREQVKQVSLSDGESYSLDARA